MVVGCSSWQSKWLEDLGLLVLVSKIKNYFMNCPLDVT